MNEQTIIIPDTLTRSDVKPAPNHCVLKSLSGKTMGTNWSAQFYAPDLPIGPIQNSIHDVFEAAIENFSNWSSNSSISRFNRANTLQEINVANDVTTVLSKALEIADATNGAFNPCLGEHAKNLTFVPEAETSTSVSGHNQLNAHWRQLEVPNNNRLTQPGNIQLDLSAIAKGYAVDQMAQALESNGVHSYLVEIGGEFVGKGVHSSGLPWWVQINASEPENNIRVALCGKALATSGSGERYLKTADQIVPHIQHKHLNNNSLTSVSILHENCMEADAWATALFAMGDKEGLKLADDLQLMALFQFKDQHHLISKALLPLTQ
ncbi:MAG: FAD:protein FMN transferase [Kordiimonas sp.]